MSSRSLSSISRLSHLRGSDGSEGDDVWHSASPSLRGSEELKDHHSLPNMILICRNQKQAAEGLFCSQVGAQRRSREKVKMLTIICVLLALLAFTFLMGSVGREDNNTQDYDADVFLPSKALWLFGCLLSWTLWLLLRLLQMFLLLIKGLLWFISVTASPLCRCASFLLSCVLLLLHYTCEAVFYTTTSPVYVYGMLLSVAISLYFFTR
ncbi:uncharacterized protein LOC117488694 [Trematomus bernacchii]|uniref:uncharacterized protein LOC117488694 n=1 Tax=Trematomus bernacchii TaxID=40690 RepID=UPI00146B1302|nr:uncharacterized protein LOC117488694 [Trematomus bernacchii]